MTELMLVEGVSDVFLISYYLQNVYRWTCEKDNPIKLVEFEKYEHIENLSKDGNNLIVCGVGGNSKFDYFVRNHRINELIREQNISSVMVVTDRDKGSIPKIAQRVNGFFPDISFAAGQWMRNEVLDSFKQMKNVDSYLLIIPDKDKGALEKTLIDALNEIPDEKPVLLEVIRFVDLLRSSLLPALSADNKAAKATVGTFFSVRNPQNAMRAFAISVSKVDWSKSETLSNLFQPFRYFGVEEKK